MRVIFFVHHTVLNDDQVVPTEAIDSLVRDVKMGLDDVVRRQCEPGAGRVRGTAVRQSYVPVASCEDELRASTPLPRAGRDAHTLVR